MVCSGYLQEESFGVGRILKFSTSGSRLLQKLKCENEPQLMMVPNQEIRAVEKERVEERKMLENLPRILPSVPQSSWLAAQQSSSSVTSAVPAVSPEEKAARVCEPSQALGYFYFCKVSFIAFWPKILS